jgi:hypothetical protein
MEAFRRYIPKSAMEALLREQQTDLRANAFKHLRFCIKQEKRIMKQLNRPGISNEDRFYLLDALENIRDCFSMATDMIAVWGLTERDDAGKSMPPVWRGKRV